MTALEQKVISAGDGIRDANARSLLTQGQQLVYIVESVATHDKVRAQQTLSIARQSVEQSALAEYAVANRIKNPNRSKLRGIF